MLKARRKTLAVIGAGPKGIAVAVKAKVLEEFGLSVSRVVLIEKDGVAAHWSGDFGYTNGEMKLGTSPEKDVVFPLETDVGNKVLNERIRQRLLQFTWTSFLAQTDRYSDWIDRGRPAPSHHVWALYLKWISEQLAPQATVIRAEVTKIDLSGDGKSWSLELREASNNSTVRVLEADSLMLTGPGKTRLEFSGKCGAGLPSGVYDLESFWKAMKSKTFSRHGRLAIVGAGENAASALLALSQYASELRADVISPKGFVSTRAEGFYENQVYSRPETNGWKELDRSDRKEFIERTDLGVFSVHAMSLLNEQARHKIIAGRVKALEVLADGISLKIDYHQRVSDRVYDQVILATGFDQLATLKGFLSERALCLLKKAVGPDLSQMDLTDRIQSDLSVEGVTPKLHLPMLAGLAQGPGFSNLSCLGLLSDRVVISSLLESSKRNPRQKFQPILAEVSQ